MRPESRLLAAYTSNLASTTDSPSRMVPERSASRTITTRVMANPTSSGCVNAICATTNVRWSRERTVAVADESFEHAGQRVRAWRAEPATGRTGARQQSQ